VKKEGGKKYKLLGFPSIFWFILLFFLFRQGVRITKEKRDKKPKDKIENKIDFISPNYQQRFRISHEGDSIKVIDKKGNYPPQRGRNTELPHNFPNLDKKKFTNPNRNGN